MYYLLCLLPILYIIKNKENIYNKKEKIKDLFFSLKKQHKTIPKSIYYTIKVICQSFIYNYSKKNNCKIEELNNKLLITYIHNNHTYKILLSSKIKPNTILSITNENDEDIQDIVIQYLGPSLDFHNQQIKPKEIGFNKIKINSIFDNYIFNSDDILKIN